MTFPLGSLGAATAPSDHPSAAPSPARSGFAPFGRLVRDPLRVRPPRPQPVWQSQLTAVVGGLLLVLWLVAMFSHDPGDAAFSTTGRPGPVHNLIGSLGAWASDLSYVVLGYSVWWCALFGLRTWLHAVARLLRADLDDREAPVAQVVPPSAWLGGLGAALVLVSSAGLEWTRLYRFETDLAGSWSGGVVGAIVGPLSSKWLGFTGSGVFWIVLLMVGVAWAFRFSWLAVAERIGTWVDSLHERRVEQRERAEDVRIGQKARRERAKVVDTVQREEPEPPPLVIETPPAPPPPSTRVAKERQSTLFTELDDNHLPQIDLLDSPAARGETISSETLEMTSRLIEKKLEDFGVKVRVLAAQPGPVITRYEIEPATGVKGSQIVGLAKDLARSLSLTSIRVVETIPGKNCMALELPNPKRQTIRLSEILGSKTYNDSASLLTMGLGKDIVGAPAVADLAKMPHLLVAGTTGSGKSVGINAMILSLLYKAEARDVRMILIDPKMLEMSVYEGIPHLLCPVVTDMKQAGNALNWCVAEMERRYKLMSKLGVRNLAGYNKKIAEAGERGELIPNPFSLTPEEPEPLDRLPHIVIVIDELADLMMVVGKKIEELIARLAQKARACGMHLILATQRPSVDVITGLIKANIPTRIAFQVSSKIDSRTILDQMGAEALLGQGDMLYLAPGTGLPVRVHGAFCSDEEVHRVVEYLKAHGEPNYIEGILEGGTVDGEVGIDGLPGGSADGEADPLYDQAVAVVLQHRRASISLVQRHLRIGYNRAARLLEQMEQSGVVSSMATNGNRDILVPARESD